MSDQARDEAERLFDTLVNAAFPMSFHQKERSDAKWVAKEAYRAGQSALLEKYLKIEADRDAAFSELTAERARSAKLVEALKNMPCEFVSLLAGSGPASVHDDGCRKCKALESFNASSDGGG